MEFYGKYHDINVQQFLRGTQQFIKKIKGKPIFLKNYPSHA